MTRYDIVNLIDIMMTLQLLKKNDPLDIICYSIIGSDGITMLFVLRYCGIDDKWRGNGNGSWPSNETIIYWW